MTSTPGGEDVEGHTRRLCVCTRIHQNNADRAVNLTTVSEASRMPRDAVRQS